MSKDGYTPRRGRYVGYLSAVVMLELYAGAFSPRDRRAVRSVVAAFDRAARILVPSGAVYEDAGHVLRALQVSSGYQVAGSPSLVNDVLIALSARSIGVRALMRSPMPLPVGTATLSARCG